MKSHNTYKNKTKIINYLFILFLSLLCIGAVWIYYSNAYIPKFYLNKCKYGLNKDACLKSCDLKNVNSCIASMFFYKELENSDEIIELAKKVCKFDKTQHTVSNGYYCSDNEHFYDKNYVKNNINDLNVKNEYLDEIELLYKKFWYIEYELCLLGKEKHCEVSTWIKKLNDKYVKDNDIENTLEPEDKLWFHDWVFDERYGMW